jgi:tartrate-resistant acid phosphatase type 5
MKREIHFEPFVHLGGLDDDSALIAWGGFYFKRDGEGWRPLDDEELTGIDGGRRDSIGVRSKPYGHAVVEVYDRSGRVAGRSEARAQNFTWVTGLEPITVTTVDGTSLTGTVHLD